MEAKLIKSKSQLHLNMKTMEEYQKSKEYKKADKCYKEIQRLKSEIFKIEGKQLKKQQIIDIGEIKKLQEEQNQAFHLRWNQTFDQMSQEIQSMRKQLAQKQEYERKKLIQEMGDQVTYSYSQSGNVIALMKKEAVLSKQHNFIEAHETQEQRKKLQEKQRAQFQKQKKAKRKYAMKKLKARHENQRTAMELKIISKLEEFRINKEKEQKIMLAKHTNTIRQFKGQQQKQNLHHSGRFTAKGGNFETLDSTTSRLKSATARSAKKFQWLKTKQ